MYVPTHIHFGLTGEGRAEVLIPCTQKLKRL